MAANPKTPKNIDNYIRGFDPKRQAILKKIRATIQRAVPDADEVISYQMPAFKQKRILVYFAAWEKHIGFYPPITGDDKLKTAVAPFAGPKGNLQFPLDRPIPYGLIARIVKHRLQQVAEKLKRK